MNFACTSDCVGSSGDSSTCLQAPRHYLTYLPQDNDGLANAQTEQVLSLINEDLRELMSSPDADFWEVIATEGSLISCLDSFLRFARYLYLHWSQWVACRLQPFMPCYSFPHWKLLLLAVVRLMKHKAFHLTPSYSSQEGSWQHTFDCKFASAAPCLVTTILYTFHTGCCGCRVNTAGSSTSSHHYQLLYDKWVLDVPKLLDLAAIYGPDNAPLVQQLMQQVTTTLPDAAAV